MKRIICFIMSAIMLTVTASAASTAKCLLQHQGSCKIYDPEAIETAIKNAVDGDTIFLTAGTFPGFTISKKITVRGAGQETKISGDISISIAGTPTLTQTVLEGVDLGEKALTLSSAMNGVKVKQAKMKYLKTSANNNDVIIDRCNITYNLQSSEFIKGMTILNSYVSMAKDSSPSNWPVNFINCYVYAYYINYCTGTFINCIVNGYTYNGRYTYENCNFVNSLLCGNCKTESVNSSTCTVQNCYESSDSSTTFDVSTLENLGYLGNDGTVVGEYGGSNPYTLELAVPKVTENTIALDVEKKVLNVSLKVSAN